MALNPLIPLTRTVPDASGLFSNILLGLKQGEEKRGREEEARRIQAEAPLRNRLMEAQTQTAEANVPTKQQKFNQSQLDWIKSVATGARQILPDLEAEKFDRVTKTLEKRLKALNDAGISNTSDTEASLELVKTNPKELIRQAKLAIEADRQISQQGTKFQFGAQQTFKDSKGNLFLGTQKRSPTTGQAESILTPVGGGAAQPVGQVSLVSGLGQTAAEQQQTRVQTAGQVKAAELGVEGELKPTVAAKTAAAKQAIKKSGEAFDRLEKINVNIANYDDGIAQLDAGAQTGAITSLFPSFRAASIQLDNVRASLGLDVIAGATFGPLSESELRFALNKAMPTKLGPEDLKRWLIKRKDVTQKLADYLSETAQFLGTPGNTVADWIQLQEIKQIESEQQPTPEEPQQQAPQVINFDAQGNIIQ